MKGQYQNGETAVDALDLRLREFDCRGQLQDPGLKVDSRADKKSPKVKSCEETSSTITNKHLKRGWRVSHSLHV